MLSLLIQHQSHLILKDDMYTSYLHGITETTRDFITGIVVNVDRIDRSIGDTLDRSCRISLTIGYVHKTLKINLIKSWDNFRDVWILSLPIEGAVFFCSPCTLYEVQNTVYCSIVVLMYLILYRIFFKTWPLECLKDIHGIFNKKTLEEKNCLLFTLVVMAPSL